MTGKKKTAVARYSERENDKVLSKGVAAKKKDEPFIKGKDFGSQLPSGHRKKRTWFNMGGWERKKGRLAFQKENSWGRPRRKKRVCPEDRQAGTHGTGLKALSEETFFKDTIERRGGGTKLEKQRDVR